MPDRLTSTSLLYLRSTPITRALESVQQSFLGMYPASCRAPSMPAPTIITRTPSDETLFPNDANCRRFAQLTKAFAQRAAERWNDSEQMGYLNRKLGKWMPEDSKTVKVDGHPRLSGIMDTVNATLAHGKATRLPKEFYEKKVLDIIDEIGVEEWFAGYKESHEYRMLGIGALVADTVTRMVEHAECRDHGQPTKEQVRFAMSGCHDTTLGGFLAGLGAFDRESWPSYTSHIAVELFRKADVSDAQMPSSPTSSLQIAGTTKSPQTSWWVSLFGRSAPQASTPAPSISRKQSNLLNPAEKDTMRDYYVRIRYNDRPVTVPGCRAAGMHLEGEESFCTLEAFKRIADAFAPVNWKRQCRERLGEAAYSERIEHAGY